jgi:hypothetical protein
MIDGYPHASLESVIEAIQRRWPGMHNPCDDQPIFVFAAGQNAGLALLERLLNPVCLLGREQVAGRGLVESLAEPLRALAAEPSEATSSERDEGVHLAAREGRGAIYPSAQDLLEAHQQFFRILWAKPAQRAGHQRWGVGEERLPAEYALYLKWLFPRARFLFLVRNPFEAFREWVSEKATGERGADGRSDEVGSAREFGRRWRDLAGSFLSGYRKVGGVLVRFEDLLREQWEPLESYLGFRLSHEAAPLKAGEEQAASAGCASVASRAELHQQVGSLAALLGYKDAVGRPVVQTPSSSLAAKAAGKNAGCAVLVPVAHHIEPACEAALQELERQGYAVRRLYGHMAIDQARSRLATEALRDGFEELMWVDADMAFDPEAVDQLRGHGLPLVCAIYPKKGVRALACELLPGTDRVVFGQAGGLLQLGYAGLGFLLTRREVYDRMQQQFGLPRCNEQFGSPLVPYFLPMVIPHGGGHWCLAEDYAFCHRARESGYTIMADTSIRLWHVGSYGYSWEDAGSDKERYTNYEYRLAGTSKSEEPA